MNSFFSLFNKSDVKKSPHKLKTKMIKTLSYEDYQTIIRNETFIRDAEKNIQIYHNKIKELNEMDPNPSNYEKQSNLMREIHKYVWKNKTELHDEINNLLESINSKEQSNKNVRLKAIS